MPSSKPRQITSYPLGWLAALRAAAAAPNQWQFIEDWPQAGRVGTAKDLGNRLRSMIPAIRNHPGFDPELTRALAAGRFQFRQFEQFPGSPGCTYRVRWTEPAPDYASIIENALAGVDSPETPR